MPEYISSSGVAHGSIAQRLLASNMDAGCLRPFIDSKTGRGYVTLNAQSKEKAVCVPTQNALLQDNEWRLMDRAILEAARPRMRIFGDLRSMVPPVTIANGMNYSVLTHQNTGVPGRAQLSMDGIVRGRQERKSYGMGGVPLPIVSKEFSLTTREIAMSRQMGTNLDTTGAVDAAQSCAEEVERIALGTADSFAYSGYSIYGYTSFPSRLTGTMTLPTGGGWTPDTARNDLLAMMQALNNAYHYGPFKLYYSFPWMRYMLQRYSTYEGASLVEILKRLPGISGVEQADYLSGYQWVLVEANPTVAQAVIGMELQTIQWEEQGGLEQVFKVMGILVPRLRADKAGNTGIAHYTGA